MANTKEKKYIIDNSVLMAEWDWEKNSKLGLNPNVLTEGAGKKVSWICSLGHQWYATPLGRTQANGTGCPYCSGHRLLLGFNDLKTVASELLLDWDFDTNQKLGLDPNNIKACSSKKAWWICHDCGHKWQTTIEARAIRHRGCIKCNRKKGMEKQLEKRIKLSGSLMSMFPSIAAEWHPTLNGPFSPNDAFPNSNKYAWWICKNGHSWKAKINHRANGSGCPYCANQKVFTGFNDLATLYPLLLKEWHPNKNLPLVPQKCLAGGQKKVWWVCEKEHEYQMSVADKLKGVKCPYCQNSKILIGYNDLATTNPNLASEWHSTKNGTLTPRDVFAGSSKHVWWMCKKGHEWLAPISRRNSGNGCPDCNKERHTSLNENIILFYLSKYFTCINSYRPSFLKGKEIDIFIPKLNVGVEYDGQFYHKSIHRDISKNNLCSSKIRLIRIREPNCPTLTDGGSTNFVLASLDLFEIVRAVKWLLELLGIKNINIDIRQDLSEIYDLIDYNEKNNSFASAHPELISQWHPTKNGKLTPFLVEQNSSKLIHWVCSNGHEWIARVYTRNKGIGCPYCSGRHPTPTNNLKEMHPQVCQEWNYELNDKRPEDYTPVSGQLVWWICSKCNTTFKMAISARTTRACGCPNCAKEKARTNRVESILKAQGALSETYPALIKEWDFENNAISPQNVVAGSSTKVWWVCNTCGHRWQAEIRTRTKQGSQCPNCVQHTKNKQFMKRVLNVEDGKFFESLTEAARYYGIGSYYIGVACKSGKLYKGYHWKFIE